MNRYAHVVGVNPDGTLVLQFLDSQLGGRPVPRPLVGSSTTGLHSVPPAGAGVVVHHDDGVVPYPWAATSAQDALGALPALAAGETAIFGSRGETLVYATATGPTVLYRNASGTIQLTIDPATGRLALTHPAGGGFVDNGVVLTAP